MKTAKPAFKMFSNPFLKSLLHALLGIKSSKKWKKPNSWPKAEAMLRYPFCCCKFLAHFPQSLRFFLVWVKGKVIFRFSSRRNYYNTSTLCVTNPLLQVPPRVTHSRLRPPYPPLSSALFPWQVKWSMLILCAKFVKCFRIQWQVLNI